MFKKDHYYIHKYGVDAVICIFHVHEFPHGFDLRVTWHILNYDRVPQGPQSVMDIFIAKEHVDDWLEYEFPS